MTAAETPTDPVETTAKAVAGLLVSISRNPIGSPTHTFMTMIRKHGYALYDTVGSDALRQVLDRIRAEAPNERAGAIRVGVVLKAWEGIAGER